MRASSYIRIILIIALCLGSFTAFAQDKVEEVKADKTEASATEEAAPATEPAEKAVEEAPAKTEQPAKAVEPKEQAKELIPAEAITPVEEKKPAEEAKAEEVKEEKPEPKEFAWAMIADRVSIGMLGDKMVTQYGVQLELTSRHFGAVIRWSKFEDHPGTLGFSFDLGFAFRYYVFGTGPSGLYVGPGFTFIHMTRNDGPLQELATPKELEIWNMVHFNRTGYGKDFDLLTPTLEVGYKHAFNISYSDDIPFYLVLGIEATIGAAISDQTLMYDTGFIWLVTPIVGFSW